MLAKAAAQKFTWVPASRTEGAPCGFFYKRGFNGYNTGICLWFENAYNKRKEETF